MKPKLLLFLGILLLNASCKDSKEPALLNNELDKTTDSTITKKPRTDAQLATLYGVNISKSGDTLLPRVPQDSVVAFFTRYGKKNTETRVRMKTVHGTIELELFKETPLYRASFIFLVKNNYFSHSYIHRTVPGFIVQAGDSDNKMTALKRSSAGNYRLPPHILPQFKHVRGSLSLAKRWENNPENWHNPFDFFLTLSASPHLDGEHTVFGKVISGMAVADRISQVETDDSDWPVDDMLIEMSVY